MFQTPPRGIRAWARRIADAGDESLAFPAAVWRRGHRVALSVLWLHPLLIVGLGVGHYDLAHTALEAAPVVFTAIMASIHWRTRTEQAGWCAVGLFSAHIFVLHLLEGGIVGHGHFFLVFALLLVYRSWTTPMVALATLLIEHGILGVRDPHSVYGHADPATTAPLVAGLQIAAVFVAFAYVFLRGPKATAVEPGPPTILPVENQPPGPSTSP